MTDTEILQDLHRAIERLAVAVDDEPRLAHSLRHFASSLPPPVAPLPPPAPPRKKLPRPGAIREVFYHALDAGQLDASRFDFLMLAENRVARGRRAHR